ncbi:MAG: P-type conjugative transfer protein TrbJ [Brevundimonas sp.]|uniref:P-type conjugative transfer protein TrbJ n=1 Tax=Brevundimonas sp. TaxID=1871086 RepID=UPI0027342900|nr:P-type conjugative transfer protein TrbJ [Brevundimonas sp.]MDP3404806.1 P-type conjugative transfer protein TrbJ [Brevundimonas sp.]
MTRVRKSLLTAVAVAALALPTSATLLPRPAVAQVAVYDPTNYAQNVLQAARALQQVNNQIQSLQNEATMLVNQARDLASLPTSSLNELQGQVARTQALLGQAQALAFDVGQIETAFRGRYGSASLSTTERDLIGRAEARWATSVGAFQDTLKVQAGVVSGLDNSRVEMSRLVTASQGATGALQAAQAGNQLLALQAAQLSELSALMAAQGRAEALEAADRAAARSEAQVRFRRFMDSTASPRP